jgi:ComF family protein
MKFHHRWPVAEILADQAVSLPRLARLLEQTDVLVPVPLYWGRQIARGYNQADALARRLRSHRPGLKLRHALVRLRNTAAQTTIHSVADRTDNLRNAFGLADDRLLRGRRVTLVDDVMTTASTLKSAARALSPAEPAELNAIVIAVADPKRRDFQST